MRERKGTGDMKGTVEENHITKKIKTKNTPRNKSRK